MKKLRVGRFIKVFLAVSLLAGGVLVLLEIFLPFGPLDLDLKPVDPRSLSTDNVFAHAMGSIDGIRYSNSLEAFQLNYSKGFRVFEVDLMLTADGNVVASHDGIEEKYGLDRPVSEITARQFKDTRFLDSYATLDLADLMMLLSSHPDAVIVLDVKSDLEATYKVIVRDVGDENPVLFKRIVPQIYREKDYFTVKNFQVFPKFIYTLYRVPPTSRFKLVNYWVGKRVLRFISGKEDIAAITMFRLRFMKSGWLVRKLQTMKRGILVHSLNDEKVIAGYLGLGATGIYTDDFDGWVKQ
ncbi:MAG: glycerophosphodiester phosphodiesterase family protein [bacterium]|nr:glycerophosphodiester phosphodiesterase family protein [bacterium]